MQTARVEGFAAEYLELAAAHPPTQGFRAVQQHVKWLESLRSELTAHCYGASGQSNENPGPSPGKDAARRLRAQEV